MMESEAKVRVRIDTSQARGDMADLTKTAQGATVRVGQSIRDSVSAGIHAIGAGGAFGSAASAFRAPTEGGISAIFGELIGPFAESAENWILGDLGVEAKANQRLQSEVLDTWGQAIGMNKSNLERAKVYADQRRPQLIQEEEGRKAIKSSTDFYSVKFDDVIKRLGEVMSSAATAAAQYLLDRLPFMGSH